MQIKNDIAMQMRRQVEIAKELKDRKIAEIRQKKRKNHLQHQEKTDSQKEETSQNKAVGNIKQGEPNKKRDIMDLVISQGI